MAVVDRETQQRSEGIPPECSRSLRNGRLEGSEALELYRLRLEQNIGRIKGLVSEYEVELDELRASLRAALLELKSDLPQKA